METRTAPGHGRATLWLLLAVAAAPVVLSYLTFYVWPPAHTTNYGDLIDAGRLPTVQVTRPDGSPFDLGKLRGKWVLVSLDSGRCDAACSRKLLYMRQLRLTQGKDMDRVERLWILTDDVAPSHDTLAAYPGTQVVRPGGTGVATLFPAPEAVAGHIYVVDPLGNIMMRFPRNPDTHRMIRDLSRLLKSSQIG